MSTDVQKLWRVAFDIGGVLSKYPHFYRAVIASFNASENIECHVITDMHDRGETLKMLADNEIDIPAERVHNSDYKLHGEACKAAVMFDEGIDVLFDDHIGYTVWPFSTPAPIRFLVMPDPRRPYNSKSWKAPGDFGRAYFLDKAQP